ncbi:MAG: PfkB family carbohydrate kinase [Planctomycetota bacterium]|jgi:sugar/nucleoside kinase (ribokinase family)
MNEPGPHTHFRHVATLVDALEHATPARVLAGFDAFIDSICHVVRHRDAPGPANYAPFVSLADLASRIHDAAGLSASFEIVTRTTKHGGNALLSASALASLGTQVDFVGAIADPNQPGRVHPLLRSVTDLFASAVPLAPPGLTDALEFNDGKLMLGRPQTLDLLTPDAILGENSQSPYTQRLAHADAMLFGNWAMHHDLDTIWNTLADDVLPASTHLPRMCCVDLADITRRSDQSIHDCVRALRSMNHHVPVTHSLNAREATHLARAIGTPLDSALDPDSGESRLTDAAAALRATLILERVIIHTHTGASCATQSGATHVRTIHNPSPRLSTGSGDHFNAGCLLALLHGADETTALATGCALASYYITNGRAPLPAELASHARKLGA